MVSLISNETNQLYRNIPVPDDGFEDCKTLVFGWKTVGLINKCFLEIKMFFMA